MRGWLFGILGLAAIGAMAGGGACGGTVTQVTSGTTGSGGMTTTTRLCTPGQTVQCGCSFGLDDGFQLCNPAGTAYGPCMGCPGTTGVGAGPGSGGSGGGTTGSGGSGGGGGGGGSLAGPPPAGPANPPDGTSTVVFAMTKIFWGDTDPDGTPDMQNGWTYFGYNIDGHPASDAAAFCKPQNGANPAVVHQHGLNGLENAFGHLIVPLFVGLNGNFSMQVDSQIASGDFTELILLGNLGSGSSYNPIPSSVAGAGFLGAVPKFDGTDVWPMVGGSKIGFTGSYVVGNTWVSGGLGAASGPFALSITVNGAGFSFTIQEPRFSMLLDVAHQKAKGGIISGIILTSDLTKQIQTVAGMIDPTLCSGPTIDSILAQVEQASDIMHDGTQDPSQTCDAISIGLGFDAVVDQVGATVPPPPPPPDPCGG